jgi:hypothetical protein
VTPRTDELSTTLSCHRCGYDLRAHPREGKCPECEASVAESRRVAAVPQRPAWRESDPRWRRRVLAGAWMLVFLPVLEGLHYSGWTERIPAANVFRFPETLRTLEETFLFGTGGVHTPLVFCMGVVLLFAKERGRRHNHLDWTRRWGVICSYVALLLGAAPILFIGALVLAGIAAAFISMPLRNQPAVTQFFIDVSTTYLLYGPHPEEMAEIVLVAFSSVLILLACVPLYDALRSSGPRWLAAVLLAPLAIFSLTYIVQVGLSCAGLSKATPDDFYSHRMYFDPDQLVAALAGGYSEWNAPGAVASTCVEGAKWLLVLAIATWLTVAQLAAWRRGTLRRVAQVGTPTCGLVG